MFKKLIISFLAVVLLPQTSAYASFWQLDNFAARSESSAGNTQTFTSDEPSLRIFLNQVPAEHSGQSLTIKLPMPDGSLAEYKIFESSIMEAGLAAKFPQIKSFKVQGIDHPGASGRVDISSKGFRAMLFTPYGRVFIDRDGVGSSRYAARRDSSQERTGAAQCGVYDLESNQAMRAATVSTNSSSLRVAGSLTAYRLAVSATPEYVTAVGGTLNAAMSEINTAINRVNEIYERDLGVRLYLIAANDILIDLPPGNAGFSNSSGSVLLSQNQAWIDSRVGDDNYDIGHIFSTGGGGVARIRSVCATSVKAQGVTGLPSPTGDAFYIDFVAHEIGHQFGGNHSFNGSEGDCGPNRNPTTAYEPGSGSTIMGYAGICGVENIQLNSEATFHAGTIAEINNFVGGSGGSCATLLPTSPTNSDPIANAGSDQTIPMATSFRLTGGASDPDIGDSLSYQWDQYDVGVATNSTTIGTDTGNNPLFRSYVPQPTAVRDFPSLANQVTAASDLAEVLPTTNRSLKFRMTVRDCKSGQAVDDVDLQVDSASGPFEITLPNTATTIATPEAALSVTWNVANTDIAPVSCLNVDIELLTFSANKSTYSSLMLLANTPNDNNQLVSIPAGSNAQARIRVSCSNNIFYDISDADLTLTGTPAFATTGNSAAISSAGSCGSLTVIGSPPDTFVPRGPGGGGAFYFLWLVPLLGLAIARHNGNRERGNLK